MVGMAKNVTAGSAIEKEKVLSAYNALANNEKFKQLISQSTTDSTNVSDRIKIATDIFMGV